MIIINDTHVYVHLLQKVIFLSLFTKIWAWLIKHILFRAFMHNTGLKCVIILY